MVLPTLARAVTHLAGCTRAITRSLLSLATQHDGRVVGKLT